MLRWIAIFLLGAVIGSSLIPVSAATPVVPGVPELTIRGLAIGQNFDKEQLRHLLNKMQCTDEQHCRGYLDILGLYADTKIEGKYHKISDVEVTFIGSVSIRTWRVQRQIWQADSVAG
jgi:hypothetical protein